MLGPGLGAQARPWSQQEAVTQDSCKGRDKRAQGTRAGEYIRQLGGVPDRHVGSSGACQSQARLHAVLEALAAAPEIKPTSQEWAFAWGHARHGSQNVQKSGEVSTGGITDGLQTSHAYILRGRDTSLQLKFGSLIQRGTDGVEEGSFP